MSITIVTDVFCDICGQWQTGATSYKAQVRKARKELKEKHGWTRALSPFTGEMADICPDCVEKYGLADPIESAS